jgi:hypothetical protein
LVPGELLAGFATSIINKMNKIIKIKLIEEKGHAYV